jgi:integrase
MTRRRARLDRAAIKRLEPGQSLNEDGITAQCMPNRDVRYTINVMVDGRRIHKAIGFASAGVTLTQCQQFIERARSEARADRLELPKGRKLAMTLATAAPPYLDRLTASGGKNLKIKARHLRDQRNTTDRQRQAKGPLIEFFGAMRLDQIESFAISRYKKERTAAGAAIATVHRELATLSHLLSQAVEWRWLNRRPAKIVKSSDEGPGRIIALDDNECDRLLAAALAGAEPLCWLFVFYGLNTAMRHEEILASRFDEIDFARRRQFVPDAKGGKRTQPLTAELVAVLERERSMREDANGWVFPSPHADSKRGHWATMRNRFAEAVATAGLPVAVTPHTLRHTAITKLVKAGVDLATIQKISGQKTLAMVLRYTHVHANHIDTAIATLGRPLGGVDKSYSNG